jgi:hypothetical protein
LMSIFNAQLTSYHCLIETRGESIYHDELFLVGFLMWLIYC